MGMRGEPSKYPNTQAVPGVGGGATVRAWPGANGPRARGAKATAAILVTQGERRRI
jgi:hypothetical protein